MALHTDTLVVAVQDRYENTDQPLNSIGAEFGISGRTVSRMANEHGWKKRSERVRDVPPAMQLLEDAKALAVVSPPPARGRSDRVAVRVGVNDKTPLEEETPTQGVTPTLTLPPIEVGFIRLRSLECQTRAGPSLDGGGSPSAIDRLEALVVQQIEAEEIKRSLYAGKRRAKTTDDRCARTLATLTQTLQALQRLRAGKNPEQERFNDDFDDRPRDIDEFRRDLARRINAFVDSRTGGNDAGRGARLKPVDGAG